MVDDATKESYESLLSHLHNVVSSNTTEVQRLQRLIDQELKKKEALRKNEQSLQAEIQRLKRQPASQPVDVPVHSNRSVEAASTRPFSFQTLLKNHEAPVHSVAMTGSLIASASWDRTIKLWDSDKEDVVGTLGSVSQIPEEHESDRMEGLYAVAFAKKDSTGDKETLLLGCTSNDKMVYLWKCRDGEWKREKKLAKHTDEVNGIDFHETQKVMCTASDDKIAIIWDFSEGVPLRTLDKHDAAVYGATFLGRQHEFLVATCCVKNENARKAQAKIWDMRDRTLAAKLDGHSDDVIGIAYHNNVLATGSDDGFIILWDIRKTGSGNQQSVEAAELAKIQTRNDKERRENEVKRVAWSANGEMLAAGCSSRRVLVYKRDAAGIPKLYDELDGHNDCVFDVAWGVCPKTDKQLLISASHDHTTRIWRESS